MPEGSRSGQDLEFARELGTVLAEWLGSDALPLARTDPDHSYAVLNRLKEAVGQYIAIGPDFLSSNEEAYFQAAIETARQVLEKDNREGVLMFEGVENEFDLAILVDVLNPRALEARRRLDITARVFEGGDYESRGPAQTADGAPSSAEDRPLFRFASPSEARKSFGIMFADSVREAASENRRTGGSGMLKSAGARIPYVVNCNLSGWTLEYWPQYNFSPSRFGSVPTSPVHDTIPTSGNYYFQGILGPNVRQDRSPHYAGSSRTSTLVNL